MELAQSEIDASKKVLTRGTTKRIFSEAGIERIAKHLEDSFASVLALVARETISDILKRQDILPNKKKTARKVKVSHVLAVTPEDLKEMVKKAEDHHVTKIPGKKDEAGEGDAEDDAEGESPDEKQQDDAGTGEEKKKPPVAEILHLAHAPVKTLFGSIVEDFNSRSDSPEKLSDAETDSDSTAAPPYVFADRAVTAAQILVERKLVIFAGLLKLFQGLGGGKPRQTTTIPDVEVLLKIKQTGL